MASLRITPEGDKDDASLPQAEERLDRIEHMLSSAEEDFRPAGSIGPEVELIFDEAVHPFQERFQEEEVVTDRYAAVADASRGESDSPRPPAPGASGPQGPQTVPLCRANEFAAVESDDADMLIIEEAYDDRPAPDACSIVPVRRLEYGQLFARMRRS